MNPQADQYIPPDGDMQPPAQEAPVTVEQVQQLLAALQARESDNVALRHEMTVMQDKMRRLELGASSQRQQDIPPDATDNPAPQFGAPRAEPLAPGAAIPPRTTPARPGSDIEMASNHPIQEIEARRRMEEDVQFLKQQYGKILPSLLANGGQIARRQGMTYQDARPPNELFFWDDETLFRT